jgi:DNA-binding MarR family transcriptional regulator
VKKDITSYTQDKDFCCPLGSLTLMLRKIGKMFRDHLSNLNVTNSQSSIFLILLKMEELSQSELGKKLDLERSTICRDLARLVDQGYLYKTKGAKSPLIGLTKKGKAFALEIFEEWEKGYKETRNLLGEEGLEALKNLEKKIL